MNVTTVPCPGCTRPNAPHRETCLYCGQRMPTPTVQTPPKERVLPANLDELVRRAMSGQGVGELKKALAQSTPRPAAASPTAETPAVPAAATPPTAPPAAATAPTAAAETVPAGVAETVPAPQGRSSSRAAPTPSAPAPDPFVALVSAASQALAARAAGQVEATRQALDDIVRYTQEARSTLGESVLSAASLVASSPVRSGGGTEPAEVEPNSIEPIPDDEPAPRSVRLPPIRHPYALILGQCPAGTETGALAAALSVDLATARNVALATGTRITLRSGEFSELDRRAHSAKKLGIEAVVCTRDQLSEAGPAWAVVGWDRVDQWRILPADLWIDPPDPQNLPQGEPYALFHPRLLVIGEVEVKRMRAETPDSKWQRRHLAPPKGAGGEVRLSVLDLVSDGRILRVCEGAFDARGIPGADPTSSRRSLKALQEAMIERFPSIRVEPRRICTAAPVLGNSGREDGWAAWEEHSRACAQLVLEG